MLHNHLYTLLFADNVTQNMKEVTRIEEDLKYENVNKEIDHSDINLPTEKPCGDQSCDNSVSSSCTGDSYEIIDINEGTQNEKNECSSQQNSVSTVRIHFCIFTYYQFNVYYLFCQKNEIFVHV